MTVSNFIATEIGKALDHSVKDDVLARGVGCGAHVDSVGGVGGRRNGVQFTTTVRHSAVPRHQPHAALLYTIPPSRNTTHTMNVCTTPDDVRQYTILNTIIKCLTINNTIKFRIFRQPPRPPPPTTSRARFDGVLGPGDILHAAATPSQRCARPDAAATAAVRLWGRSTAAAR